VKSRFLIESEDDDQGIDPERYVNELPPTFQSICASFGLPLRQIPGAVKVWTGIKYWPLAEPIRAGTRHIKSICLNLHFYPERKNYRVCWYTNRGVGLAYFQSRRESPTEMAKSLQELLPKLEALGQRVSQLRVRSTGNCAFHTAFISLPEFKAAAEGMTVIPLE